MTERQRKTLGLATASLVCGMFFFIPLLGFFLSLAAIVLGIIALVKLSKNKETLKGKGLAIGGIVLGGLGIVAIPLIALLAAIAIPNLLRAKISANEALAQSTLRSISVACESFYEANGSYPGHITDLTLATPSYINTSPCGQTVQGYQYHCVMTPEGYQITASPESEGTTGTKIFTIQTNGALSVKDLYPSTGSYSTEHYRSP